MFRAKYLRQFQGFAQELQAEINSGLLDTLSESEMHDWTRFGKVRQAWEKYLKDPDDVFIEAKDRRRQLERQGRKLPDEQEKPLRRKRVQARRTLSRRPLMHG